MQNYLQAKQEFAKGLNEYGYNGGLKIYKFFFLALMFVYQKALARCVVRNVFGYFEKPTKNVLQAKIL